MFSVRWYSNQYDHGSNSSVQSKLIRISTKNISYIFHVEFLHWLEERNLRKSVCLICLFFFCSEQAWVLTFCSINSCLWFTKKKKTENLIQLLFTSVIAIVPDHRQIHNKPDHLPSLVVEAGLEQVWPFCCWYTPPTFHTHFNRILCAVNMFIGVLFKEKYHLYTNNAQD